MDIYTGGDMKDGPQPLYHDIVLSPNQLDPACFWSPYHENQEAQAQVCFVFYFEIYSRNG
jgi:hypothetical protein